ncbi:redoxin domain-containing protein [bacterium]|nr:MAG: redoxin domain-containing protein [bacterium]
MIQIGDTVDTTIRFKVIINGEEKETTLAELLTKPMVISVYMKNNTSSCDNQNISLAHHAKEIEKRGFVLMSVSKDTCGSHKKYAAKHGIGYILASDPDYNIANAFDSVVEKSMYGKTFVGPSRSAYVLDTQGKVLGIIEKVESKHHGEEILNLLDGLSN